MSYGYNTTTGKWGYNPPTSPNIVIGTGSSSNSGYDNQKTKQEIEDGNKLEKKILAGLLVAGTISIAIFGYRFYKWNKGH